MQQGLKGVDELQWALVSLRDKAAGKAARAGVNAALTPLVRAMRMAINGSSASPELKRAARQTIGKRVKKPSGQVVFGKAGFGVGRQSAIKKLAAHIRAGDKSQRGVGISAANIHWPVLGTEERKTDIGHPTGKMPPQLPHVIQSAVSASSSAMLEAARAKITKVLAAEAAKLRKG